MFKTSIRKSLLRLSLVALFLSVCPQMYAQPWPPLLTPNPLSGQQNIIFTAVPFLMITPDARSAGMGETGAASEADAYSIHWNAAKLGFAEKKAEVAVSYSPWLRSLVPGINLGYLSGYYCPNKRSALSGSIRYFDLGTINFTDVTGQSVGSFDPWEVAIDAAYSTKLSKYFSMAVGFRYIYSNIAGHIFSPSVGQLKPGTSLAGDISAFYKRNLDEAGSRTFSMGANISNIGSKLTYTTSVNADFIPANFRLGTAYKITPLKNNTLTFLFDFNKLMVPTPGGPNNNSSVPTAIAGSFTDAPGGFMEEIREVISTFGIELWNREKYAFRTGASYESSTKGNRQFATLGAGMRHKFLQLDASYLIPFESGHPLSHNVRISLSARFGN
jgi:hypothetical protein